VAGRWLSVRERWVAVRLPWFGPLGVESRPPFASRVVVVTAVPAHRVSGYYRLRTAKTRLEPFLVTCRFHLGDVKTKEGVTTTG
jgi:hypothetical protein